MRGQSSFGRIGRALLAVVLGFFGVLTPMFTGTSSATLGPALQSVGITWGYYLFNAAPYVLTLIIMIASSSATETSADMPAELTVLR